MYPVFGLGKVGFTKLAEQDPEQRVYGFEFWTTDLEMLMRQIELCVGPIAPSWVKEE